jgi:uncharacterized protein (TIGR03435 family)
MKRFVDSVGTQTKQVPSAAGLVVLAASCVYGLATATQCRAQLALQSQTQSYSAVVPTQEYDVVSIKPSRPDTGAGIKVGMRDTPDGFTATNVPLLFLVQYTYGVNPYQISGAPSWFNSDRYDVEAKMDSSVAEALQKMSLEDRTIARRKMLQAVLADRVKLIIHRDTKDLPVYSLVVSKNGPKLQISKPVAPSVDGANGPEGNGRGGGMSMRSEDGYSTATFQALPVANLAAWLSLNLHSPVQDKTGLTGNYDFKIRWMPDRNRAQTPLADATNGQPPVVPLDTSGPNLLEALQDQLGLKLESGKGPVEIIVIDHVERPSAN